MNKSEKSELYELQEESERVGEERKRWIAVIQEVLDRSCERPVPNAISPSEQAIRKLRAFAISEGIIPDPEMQLALAARLEEDLRRQHAEAVAKLDRARRVAEGPQ